MADLSGVTGFVKEVASSIQVQVATSVGFGTGLLLTLFSNYPYSTIGLATAFAFTLAMSITSLIIKIVAWRTEKKNVALQRHKAKLGLMGEHQYNHKIDAPWPDKTFDGLGWQIAINELAKQAFLCDPMCLTCRTNMITRTNASCDGFYLECPECNHVANVDDIGEARAIADARLKGDVRTSPRKYFEMF